MDQGTPIPQTTYSHPRAQEPQRRILYRNHIQRGYGEDGYSSRTISNVDMGRIVTQAKPYPKWVWGGEEPLAKLYPTWIWGGWLLKPNYIQRGYREEKSL